MLQNVGSDIIILYIFTAYGIFIWDEYPSYQKCRGVQAELVTWFSGNNNQDLYSVECIGPGIDNEDSQ